MLPDVVILNDTSYIDGGAAAVAVHSAIGLARVGFRVSFIAAIGPIAPELQQNGVKTVLAQPFRVGGGPGARLTLQRTWNFSAAKATACILDGLDRRNCVVHAHNWHDGLSASAPSTALERQFELICTLNDYAIACPTGGFFDYKANRICPIKPLSTKCIMRACTQRRAGKALAVVRQMLQAHADVPRKVRHFITVSEFSESVLRPYFSEAAKVYRVSNPIQVKRSEPIAVARNRTYSMVARLEAAKGVLLFAEAARRGGFESRFVGDGSSREEIRRINPAAEITGWMPTESVWEYLRSSRCLVFPSLWYEAQPLAVLSASSVGVPSIVSDACAARDLVEDGVTGLLFKNGDAESLLSGLRHLQEDELVATLGRNAYNRFWADPPTIERHVDDLAAIYRDVLALRQRPAVQAKQPS